MTIQAHQPGAEAQTPDTGRWNNDGWDVTARLGVVVPHADVGPESELRAMAPDHLGCTPPGGTSPRCAPAGRWTRPSPTTPFRPSASRRMSTSVWPCSPKPHSPVNRPSPSDSANTACRMPVTTICRAAERALRTLDVDRFALVNPPWFDAAGGAYFADLGFEVVHHVPCGLPSGQPHITPSALFDWVS